MHPKRKNRKITPKRKREIIKYFFGWEVGVPWISKNLKLRPAQIEAVIRDASPKLKRCAKAGLKRTV